MYFINVASGSSGNCTVVVTKTARILIDFGITKRKFTLSLKPYDITLSQIDALIYTHAHIDHLRGDFPVKPSKIYSTKKAIANPEINYIEPDVPFFINETKITPLKLSHDAPGTIGLIIEEDNTKLVYITDTGYISEKNLKAAKNATFYILESNHDPIELLHTDRSFDLIVRILGDKGHLSNEDSAYYLTKMIGPKTKEVYLAHLSKDANNRELALKTFHEVFERENISLDHVLLQTFERDDVTFGGYLED
jgi:phosphoribosyl 1,2-cyclic phosphodiesterase